MRFIMTCYINGLILKVFTALIIVKCPWHYKTFEGPDRMPVSINVVNRQQLAL